ncbi:DEAD-box ATP-dependent RNA helicase CshA [subsurface metagenome]
MENLNPFEQIGLTGNSLEALRSMGFEQPTEIQLKVIPLLLNGERDIIGQAQTGTGKTAAFGLPILEKIEQRGKAVQALILTPTRELAIQVAKELDSLAGRKAVSIASIYGGQSIVQQIRKLRAGVDIVVGTPGRVIDHINRKTLKLSKLSFMVLDEADEMLNMGFIEDVEEILGSVDPGRRMMLFSATMPQRIRKIAEKYMGDYDHVTVNKEQPITELTEQIYFDINEKDKFEALCRIADIEEGFYGLIFCRTKVNVDELARRLAERGYNAEALHGDITQPQRELILNRFRKRGINILVATDVAARGIDINNLTHVINYSLPNDSDSYIHRIGRTGRAGNLGVAITFVSPAEYGKLQLLKGISKSNIRKARLPHIDDVIRAKWNRIVSEVEEIGKNGECGDFREMAGALLKDTDHEEVLAAVLRVAFGEKLDRNKYREIKEVSSGNSEKTKLFIQMGRKDGLTKRKLVNLLERKSAVSETLIRDTQIFDIYSRVTVPLHTAEIIVRAFKNRRSGKRPLVEIAGNPRKGFKKRVPVR